MCSFQNFAMRVKFHCKALFMDFCAVDFYTVAVNVLNGYLLYSNIFY